MYKTMAKVCQFSGRKAQAGRWTRHTHSGAWAHRAPQKGRRFEVNLQTVTLQTPCGKKKIRIAARMMTSRAFQSILSGQKPVPKHLMK